MKKILTSIILLATLLPSMAQTRIPRSEAGGVEWTEVVNNGKHGAEINGKMAIPAQYDLIYYTQNHYIAKSKGKAAIYDKDGNRVISEYQGYSSIRPHDMTGYIWYEVKDGNHQGICNQNGMEILSPSKGYEKAVYHAETAGKPWIEVVKDGKAGALDDQGREFIPTSRGYDSVSARVNESNERYFSVVKDSSYGICDKDGVEIIPPVYSTIVFYSSGDYKYRQPDGSYEVITPGRQPESPTAKEPAPKSKKATSSTNNVQGSPANVAKPAGKTAVTEGFECIICNGNGICTVCNGSGITYNSLSQTNNPCSYCNQTGKCNACKGTGKQ